MALVGGASGELPRGLWAAVGGRDSKLQAAGQVAPGSRAAVGWRGQGVSGQGLRHSSLLGRRRAPVQAGAVPREAVCLGPHAAPHLVLITG